MDSKELLEQLTQQFPRQRKALYAIASICEQQLKNGIYDFSYASISRLGAGLGVPAAQSIRNATGVNYRSLIKSYEDSPENKVRTHKKRRRQSEDWVEEISNPKIKFLANKTLARLAECEKIIKELIPPGLEIVVNDRSYCCPFEITPVELRALQHLLSDDFFREWKLNLGQHGDVLNEHGKTVFKPGTIDALRKIVDALTY